jgi:BirA family biotin operon repressor/biotin-[acetyl-CoA-carboxylase] ligase
MNEKKDLVITDCSHRDSELTRLGLLRSSSLFCDGVSLSGWRDMDDPEEVTLYTAEICGSGMDLLQRLVDDGLAPVWSSVLVAAQRSGRGQSGRVWHSPPGNVYGSLRLPTFDSTWRNTTSLLVGAGVLSVLLEMNLDARIKWPNDILVGSRKVCGILIEERHDLVKAGIGLNLKSAPSPHLMRDGYAAQAAFLADFGVKISPAEMWIRLVRRIKKVVIKTTSGLSREEFVENMVPRLAYLGETVAVNTGNGKNRTGTLLGLDPCGGITLRTSAGDQVFYSGGMYSPSVNRSEKGALSVKDF